MQSIKTCLQMLYSNLSKLSDEFIIDIFLLVTQQKFTSACEILYYSQAIFLHFEKQICFMISK